MSAPVQDTAPAAERPNTGGPIEAEWGLIRPAPGDPARAEAYLPPPCVRNHSDEVNKALTSGGLRERRLREGYILAPGTPEAFARFQAEDMQRSEANIREANIQPE